MNMLECLDEFDPDAEPEPDSYVEIMRAELAGERRSVEILMGRTKKQKDEIEELKAEIAKLHQDAEHREALMVVYVEPCPCRSMQRVCPKCGG